MVYSSSKLVWLPSMLSSISALSNMAILYIPMDCPMPSMMVTACSSIMDTHCVSSPVASYSETYLSGLSSCSMYTVHLPPGHQQHHHLEHTEQVLLLLQSCIECLTRLNNLKKLFSSPYFQQFLVNCHKILADWLHLIFAGGHQLIIGNLVFGVWRQQQL